MRYETGISPDLYCGGPDLSRVRMSEECPERILQAVGPRQLPESLGRMSMLQRLELGFCGGLDKLPDQIGALASLVELDLLW